MIIQYYKLILKRMDQFHLYAMLNHEEISCDMDAMLKSKSIYLVILRI